MSDIAKNSSKKKWGDEASKRFIKFPVELLYHYRELELNDEDVPLLLWVEFYQWGEKAAFPHPSGLAYMLHTDYKTAVAKLKDLAARGYIALETTASNPTNFHQDLRPTRNLLRKYLVDNPGHCAWQNETDPKRRIDTSNRFNSETDISNSTDISIPSKKPKSTPESLDRILKRKKQV